MASEIAHLASRALIGISGPDWRSFLQGLITQDVETLQLGETRYGALLTPQGRLAADLFITGGEDGATLDVAAGGRAELMDKLTIYRLRAKVEIAPLSDRVFAAWGGQSPGDGWIADPRRAALGWRRTATALDSVEAEAAYDAHRLALGVPDPAKDGAPTDYPIELNVDLLHGIDFKKGCFVGQETTSRMHRRGVVKTRVAPIVFDGDPLPFGAEVLAGDLRAGEVRGGEAGRALALLRIDRAAAGALTVNGLPVRLDLPSWLADLFQTQVDQPPQSGAMLSP